MCEKKKVKEHLGARIVSHGESGMSLKVAIQPLLVSLVQYFHGARVEDHRFNNVGILYSGVRGHCGGRQ